MFLIRLLSLTLLLPVIVFSSSIATAIIAIILTGLLYFKSLSELEEMTNTSKEALVVFAENVENVNKAVDNMNSSLSKHTDLVNANDQIQIALDNLSNAIKSNDKIQCWGRNLDNQVSDTPTTDTFNFISSGEGHSCAISSTTHKITCWGKDHENQVSNVVNDVVPIRECNTGNYLPLKSLIFCSMFLDFDRVRVVMLRQGFF